MWMLANLQEALENAQRVFPEDETMPPPEAQAVPSPA